MNGGDKFTNQMKAVNSIINKYEKDHFNTIDIAGPMVNFNFSKKYEEQPDAFKEKIKEERIKINKT